MREQSAFKSVTFVIIILNLLIGAYECGKFGGGGGSRSRGGSYGHRSSPSRPSYPSHPSQPSYPSPSHPSYPSQPSRPSYPSSHPASPNPSDIGWKQPAQPSKPDIGWKQPVDSAPHAPPVNSKPIGWAPPANNPQTHYPAGNNPPQPPKVTYPGSNNPPHYPGGNPPQNHYPGSNVSPNKVNYPGSASQPNRPVGWDLPPAPRPGHPPQPIGPPINSYQSGSYSGPSKVKIVNNHYHSPGYYSLPQPSYHAGYYQTPTTYHYTSHDTGSGALGFFLGYSLAKLTTPTYNHYSFYDGYRPRYDHYTVHHYYHDKEAVPQNPVVQANAIVGCVGDSSSICPANTTSLCTSNGALMCVASAFSTVPCTNNAQVNCVKSTIPCVNNTSPECKDAQNNNTIVSIPCVSTAKIYGDLTFVNNTIIVNATTSNSSAITNVTTTTPVPVNTTAQDFSPSTKYPITTTTPEAASTQYPITTTPSSTRRKRASPAQDFCVTILALPAKKTVTEGEQVFNNTKSLVTKFLAKAWGLS